MSSVKQLFNEKEQEWNFKNWNKPKIEIKSLLAISLYHRLSSNDSIEFFAQ